MFICINAHIFFPSDLSSFCPQSPNARTAAWLSQTCFHMKLFLLKNNRDPGSEKGTEAGIGTRTPPDAYTNAPKAERADQMATSPLPRMAPLEKL